MQTSSIQTIETAEGPTEITKVSTQQLVAMIHMAAVEKRVDIIPDLVEQIRVSEERYILHGENAHGMLAGVCAEAARTLLDIKYGPIPGLMTTPPVDKRGHYQW